MADGVVRFRRKPDQPEGLNYAARFEPGKPMADLLRVARMADSGAQLIVPEYGSSRLLVVLHRAFHDEHPATTEALLVEPGGWLAYSESSDLLYAADDGNWRQLYETVDPE
jgi:hypothetical protein